MNKEQLRLIVTTKKREGLSMLAIGKYLNENYPEKSITAWRFKAIRELKRIDSEMGVNANMPVIKIGDGVSSFNDLENETTTETNQYPDGQPPMSAMKSDGTIMTVEEYCVHYGLPASFARTAKLVAHTGVPRYNIASNVLGAENDLMPIDEFKELIRQGLEGYQYYPKFDDENDRGIIVVKISDLHFGAYIDNLIKTKKFSIGILADLLNEAATIINNQCAAEVHVHIHGDLIESFTGLNHKNSWKGLQKSMIGAEVVKLCTKVLHTEFLSRIYNLKTIKLVAGNHDRVTSAKDEDTDGDAASLIAWGLELMNYDVQFDPFVIKHVVDNICYIIMHGDKAIAKRSTKSICFDYGQQGIFNVVGEGHLHTLMQSEGMKKKEEVTVTDDDAVDHIRIKFRAFFTGNSFSEYLGFTSTSGFSILKNNGKGIPNIFHFAL